jgi:hypothetical protein
MRFSLFKKKKRKRKWKEKGEWKVETRKERGKRLLKLGRERIKT